MATVDPPEVVKLKGDGRMASVIRAAVWSAVKPMKLSFGYGRFILRLDTDQVDGMIGAIWQRGLSYRAARRQLVDDVAHAFAEEYARRSGKRGPAGGARELREVTAAARSHLKTTGSIAEILPAAEPHDVLQRLYTDNKTLTKAGASLTTKERMLLRRSPVPGKGSMGCGDPARCSRATATRTGS